MMIDLNSPDDDALPAWKTTLHVITGARHGGQIETVLDQLIALNEAHPHVAEIVYQIAWTLDSMDREAEALPHYERAIALGLPPNELSGALLGLGSTLRELGQLERAADTLESGRTQFPANREFDVFLALVRHDQGRSGEALQLALTVLVDTSEDIGVTAYQRTIRHQIGKLMSQAKPG